MVSFWPANFEKQTSIGTLNISSFSEQNFHYNDATASCNRPKDFWSVTTGKEEEFDFTLWGCNSKEFDEALNKHLLIPLVIEQKLRSSIFVHMGLRKVEQTTGTTSIV